MPPDAIKSEAPKAAKRPLWRRLLKYALVGLAVLVGLAGAGLLALGLHQPTLTIHTLTDGSRTITYVEMVHVGAPAYFDRVRARIREEGGKGATYLYEGVRGTPEESGRLSTLIGFDEGGGSMRDWTGLLMRLSDLDYQPQASFLGLTGRPDINADLSAGDLVKELEATASGAPKVPKGLDPQAFAKADAQLREAGGYEQGTLAHATGRYLVRSGLKLRLLFTDALRMPPDIEAAFAKRDAYLLRKVEETPGDLVVTYGGAHYATFSALLGTAWREVRSEANPVFE